MFSAPRDGSRISSNPHAGWGFFFFATTFPFDTIPRDILFCVFVYNLQLTARFPFIKKKDNFNPSEITFAFEDGLFTNMHLPGYIISEGASRNYMKREE